MFRPSASRMQSYLPQSPSQQSPSSTKVIDGRQQGVAVCNPRLLHEVESYVNTMCEAAIFLLVETQKGQDTRVIQQAVERLKATYLAEMRRQFPADSAGDVTQPPNHPTNRKYFKDIKKAAKRNEHFLELLCRIVQRSKRELQDASHVVNGSRERAPIFHVWQQTIDNKPVTFFNCVESVGCFTEQQHQVIARRPSLHRAGTKGEDTDSETKRKDAMPVKEPVNSRSARRHSTTSHQQTNGHGTANFVLNTVGYFGQDNQSVLCSQTFGRASLFPIRESVSGDAHYEVLASTMRRQHEVLTEMAQLRIEQMVMSGELDDRQEAFEKRFSATQPLVLPHLYVSVISPGQLAVNDTQALQLEYQRSALDIYSNSTIAVTIDVGHGDQTIHIKPQSSLVCFGVNPFRSQQSALQIQQNRRGMNEQRRLFITQLQSLRAKYEADAKVDKAEIFENLSAMEQLFNPAQIITGSPELANSVEELVAKLAQLRQAVVAQEQVCRALRLELRAEEKRSQEDTKRLAESWGNAISDLTRLRTEETKGISDKLTQFPATNVNESHDNIHQQLQRYQSQLSIENAINALQENVDQLEDGIWDLERRHEQLLTAISECNDQLAASAASSSQSGESVDRNSIVELRQQKITECSQLEKRLSDQYQQLYQRHQQLETHYRQYWNEQRADYAAQSQHFREWISLARQQLDRDIATAEGSTIQQHLIKQRDRLLAVVNCGLMLTDIDELYYTGAWQEDDNNLLLQALMVRFAEQLQVSVDKGCKAYNDRGRATEDAASTATLTQMACHDGIYPGRQQMLNPEIAQHVFAGVTPEHNRANHGSGGAKFQSSLPPQIRDHYSPYTWRQTSLWGKTDRGWDKHLWNFISNPKRLFAMALFITAGVLCSIVAGIFASPATGAGVGFGFYCLFETVFQVGKRGRFRYQANAYIIAATVVLAPVDASAGSTTATPRPSVSTSVSTGASHSSGADQTSAVSPSLSAASAPQQPPNGETSTFAEVLTDLGGASSTPGGEEVAPAPHFSAVFSMSPPPQAAERKRQAEFAQASEQIAVTAQALAQQIQATVIPYMLDMSEDNQLLLALQQLTAKLYQGVINPSEFDEKWAASLTQLAAAHADDTVLQALVTLANAYTELVASCVTTYEELCRGSRDTYFTASLAMLTADMNALQTDLSKASVETCRGNRYQLSNSAAARTCSQYSTEGGGSRDFNATMSLAHWQTLVTTYPRQPEPKQLLQKAQMFNACVAKHGELFKDLISARNMQVAMRQAQAQKAINDAADERAARLQQELGISPEALGVLSGSQYGSYR